MYCLGLVPDDDSSILVGGCSGECQPRPMPVVLGSGLGLPPLRCLAEDVGVQAARVEGVGVEQEALLIGTKRRVRD